MTTTAEKKLVEETRTQARAILERLEHTCALARIAVAGEEPESGAEFLLDTFAELTPKLPTLRRALRASRKIP